MLFLEASEALQKVQEVVETAEEVKDEVKNTIEDVEKAVDEAIGSTNGAIEEVKKNTIDRLSSVEDDLVHEDLVEKIREEVEKFAANFVEPEPEIEAPVEVVPVEETPIEENHVQEELGDEEMGWAIDTIAEESEVSDSESSDSTSTTSTQSPTPTPPKVYMPPPTIRVTPPEGSRTPSPNEEIKPPSTPKKKAPNRGGKKSPNPTKKPKQKSAKNESSDDGSSNSDSNGPKRNAFLQLAAQQRTTRTWQRKVQSRRQAIQNDMVMMIRVVFQNWATCFLVLLLRKSMKCGAAWTSNTEIGSTHQLPNNNFLQISSKLHFFDDRRSMVTSRSKIHYNNIDLLDL